jgi:hypothetical protein
MYDKNEDRTIKIDYLNGSWKIGLDKLDLGFYVHPSHGEPEFKTLLSINGVFSKTKGDKEDALAYMGALGILSYLDGRAANVVFGEGVAEYDHEAFVREHYGGIAEISGAVRKHQKNHNIGRFVAWRISGRIAKKYPVLRELRGTIKQTLRKGKW